jgi:tetratricopeptide (TPR) repeat protein
MMSLSTGPLGIDRLRPVLTSRILLLSGLLLAQAAPGAPQQAAEPEIERWLPPGTAIVLKESDTPLQDQDWLSPRRDQLVFVIESVSGDRLLVVSHDKSCRGWLRRDQVVPLDQAIGYFSQEIGRSPHNGDAYWMRGRLWAYRGDDDRAIADLDQAIQFVPDQARFYLRRGLLLIQNHHFDRALADCDKAIQLDPKATGAYVVRASIWLSKGEPQRARADLDEVIRLDPLKPVANPLPPVARELPALEPNGSPALLAIASLSQKTGGEDPPSAGERTPAQRGPKNAREWVSRGLTWYEKKEYNKAIADFTAAIRIDPNDAYAYACRARAWASKQYRDREAADYTEAIRLDPRNIEYRIARADSWSAQGRHEQAIADYDDAIRAEPNNAANYVARGNEWRKHLKLDAALADFERAIQVAPNYFPAYIGHALIAKQRRAFDQAVFELSQLVRMAPDNAEAHRTLARILATCTNEAVRDGNRAVGEATRACELTGWRDPDCLDTLAAAYAETGDYATAIQWQTRAIGLLRQNVPSTLQRAMDFGGRRGVGFEGRLAFYKGKRPCRE